MLRDGLPRGVLCLIAIGAIGAALTGCGGGEAGPAGPELPPGNSTITGRVVNAANVSQGLADAQVSVLSVPQQRGRAVKTDEDGEFMLTGVPAGVVRVQVISPSASYRNATVDLEVPDESTVTVVITLVPAAVAAPASVVVSPLSASVQVGVPKVFTAVVRDADGNLLDIAPTWSASAGVGTILTTAAGDGEFTGTAEGSATVSATAGGATGTAVVTVTPATAPEVSGVTAAPTTLGPTGGEVLFTAQVTAGGRIQSAVLRVRRQGAVTGTDVPLTPLAGSTEFAASYEQSYTFGPNDSPGFADDNVYSVSVVATDMRGLQAESEPITVVVLAADQPPPEPT